MGFATSIICDLFDCIHNRQGSCACSAIGINKVLIMPIADFGDPAGFPAGFPSGQCDSYLATPDALKDLVAKAENGES